MFEKFKCRKKLNCLLKTNPTLKVYIYSASCNHYIILVQATELEYLSDDLQFKSIDEAKQFLKRCGLKTVSLIQHTAYEEMDPLSKKLDITEGSITIHLN